MIQGKKKPHGGGERDTLQARLRLEAREDGTRQPATVANGNGMEAPGAG